MTGITIRIFFCISLWKTMETGPLLTVRIDLDGRGLGIQKFAGLSSKQSNGEGLDR